MMTPIETLRNEAQTEFDKVNPTYFMALKALASLDLQDVAEVKKYERPPVGVKLVVEALCLLFDQPQTYVIGARLFT